MTRAKPSISEKKAAYRHKDRLPGAYYVGGPSPYLLVIVRYNRDITRKIVRIPEGQVTIETMEMERPEQYPEVTSRPISYHLLTIDSPRKVPVLLRIDMGSVEYNLDDYTSVNDSRQHFHYRQSNDQYYGTIWLNGGHNPFRWVRDEGA